MVTRPNRQMKKKLIEIAWNDKEGVLGSSPNDILAPSPPPRPFGSLTKINVDESELFMVKLFFFLGFGPCYVFLQPNRTPEMYFIDYWVII